MELIDRIKEALRKELGINSDAELIEAVESMEELDISIFLMPIEGNYEKAAI